LCPKPSQTRKVAGSIPAGTTLKASVQRVFLGHGCVSEKTFEAVMGPKNGAHMLELLRRTNVERVRHRHDHLEFVVVEIGVEVGSR
jgi:hypothetical protein